MGPRDRVRPLIGGIQIGVYGSSAVGTGTLTGVFTHQPTQTLVGLTSRHTIRDSRIGGQPGTPVAQPSGTTIMIGNDQIGTVWNVEDVDLDCALIQLAQGQQSSRNYVMDAHGTAKELRLTPSSRPASGTVVSKCGHKTDYTEGVVVAGIDIAAVPGTSNTMADHCFLVKPTGSYTQFADHGDSGAPVWVANGDMLLGMIYADFGAPPKVPQKYHGYIAVVLINKVFDAMNLSL